MPTSVFAGSTAATNLAEILSMLVRAKQTGTLVLQNAAEEEGTVTMENGMILSARAGVDSGMRALFEFVAWHEAHFEFRQQALASGINRDLAVYDPEVLIAGVAAKVGTIAPATTAG